MTREPGATELADLVSRRTGPEAQLLLVGWLTARLEGAPVVLVGGGAVELYTDGAYTTGDVDLVGDHRVLRGVLLAAGFKEEGRLFVNDELRLVAEVPRSSLRDNEEVVHVEFEGMRIPVVTPADVIVDRLLAATSWDSPTDWEQALLVLEAQRDGVDLDALRVKAEANEVAGALEELLSAAGAT